jgi:hypothetical protein
MARVTSWSFECELWESDSFAAWAFVSVPVELADELRVVGGPPRGFGSLRVEVRIGLTTWRTSVFPDGETYVMPLKKEVRRREGLELGDRVVLDLRLVGRDEE